MQTKLINLTGSFIIALTVITILYLFFFASNGNYIVNFLIR